MNPSYRTAYKSMVDTYTQVKREFENVYKRMALGAECTRDVWELSRKVLDALDASAILEHRHHLMWMRRFIYHHLKTNGHDDATSIISRQEKKPDIPLIDLEALAAND